ncbi:MAG: hypothetical protein ACK4RV_18015 [Caulobacter sp.]
MTRQRKKTVEAAFVEEAARLLGVRWEIQKHREHPDFVISDGSSFFGLELVQLFVDQGPRRGGSALKEAEAYRAKLLDKVRREYQARTGLILDVKVLGAVTPSNATEILEALLANDMSALDGSGPIKLRTPKGLKLFVSKAFHPTWRPLGDAVGWVRQDPSRLVQEIVRAKSLNLDRYRQAVGSDVRLLIVADRRANSGRAMFTSAPVLDWCGFSAVYFLSYPDQAIPLTQAAGP